MCTAVYGSLGSALAQSAVGISNYLITLSGGVWLGAVFCGRYPSVCCSAGTPCAGGIDSFPRYIRALRPLPSVVVCFVLARSFYFGIVTGYAKFVGFSLMGEVIVRDLLRPAGIFLFYLLETSLFFGVRVCTYNTSHVRPTKSPHWMCVNVYVKCRLILLWLGDLFWRC